MKRGILLLLILFCFLSTNGQEQKIDTVETEIVNVVTKFNPEIADAKKINKNPVIKLLGKSKKQKLTYSIYSAPVASTFIPKTGAIKGIDVGVKERVYNNYLAAGYGNYGSPYAEAFIYKNTRFDNEYGLSAKYIASTENVRDSKLNSNFSNFQASLFYKQVDRYFDWKVGLNTELSQYNWYGLPNMTFDEPVLNTINELQKYNYVKVDGDFKFHDSYIDYGKISVSYFTDLYNSKEILANFNAKLNFPLDFLGDYLNDISIKTNVEFLNGSFENNYAKTSKVNYNIITAKLNPEYKVNYAGFSIKTALNIIASLDTENNATNIFLYPDIFAQTAILKNYVNIYAGITGNLHTNTYKQFTEENQYVSPTLFITQTAETSNLFLGLQGNITNEISYNIKGSSIKEEDKPLFLRNNTKSDGTNASVNGRTLAGYEYGNSFYIYYDDVKTTSFYGEIAYDYSRKLSFSTQFQFDNFTMTNAIEKWNLPTLQASFLGKYKEDKWFATTNIFYVSERKDALYNAQFPSSLRGIETINSFIDVNLNGGYHFNDKFSAFLKANNILNTKYQRFANFDTQGFQILGGITYKFDF
ncbi:TonB-dependent receptor [Polaribacter aestuariivivens]|uniref:TonB-dependent receptor n=1 Tax=Polaribacter aestuariivivens TaxID=2304626 RepID=A0A5S3N2T8_9FLAO|nr:TonB-dependent receptor [Polaribacter aestuariivivens]TMM29533.1 TonB-dependent receptor [Polaribacter aestuariivivens]